MTFSVRSLVESIDPLSNSAKFVMTLSLSRRDKYFKPFVVSHHRPGPTKMTLEDPEANAAMTRIHHLQQILDRAGITPEVQRWDYPGSGTQDDPFIVSWIDNDPRNPLLYSPWKKWSITAVVAVATLAIAFVSSAYSGGAEGIILEFGCSREMYTLGLSLFVLGFAIGPLL
jgi:hypothetical protein